MTKLLKGWYPVTWDDDDREVVHRAATLDKTVCGMLTPWGVPSLPFRPFTACPTCFPEEE